MFNALEAIMLNPAFHGKYIIMTPLSFFSHGGWRDSLGAVVESVWQPAASSVSQLFQSGSFAFMQYNNMLSQFSWESAPLSAVAYGIVWSEFH